MKLEPVSRPNLARAALGAALIGAAAVAFAAMDGSAGPADANDALAGAREHLVAKRWSAAIDELKRINAADSANWNSLMGYASRKQPTPDLAAAERFYDAALRLEPKHRGALEYSGELYLMKGDLARAEQRLQALDTACLLPCDEQRDLRQAIERYKSNGNRQVQSTY